MNLEGQVKQGITLPTIPIIIIKKDNISKIRSIFFKIKSINFIKIN